MTALPTLPNSPAVGDPGAASWADNVAAVASFLMNPPICQVWQNSAQSIPTAAQTAVTWDQETLDTSGMHSLLTNTNRFTAVYPGTYEFTGQAGMAGSTAGQRYSLFALNGTAILGSRIDGIAAAGGTPLQNTFQVAMVVGDYVDFQVFQNSGGALALSAGRCALSVVWVST
jgi:hypothetical protein